MSARVLSMGFTTLRFTRAGHEIACRYFLTHLMTSAVRPCVLGTRRRAVKRSRATAHMQSVPHALENIRGRKLREPGLP
jgi:hypothetical protein